MIKGLSGFGLITQDDDLDLNQQLAIFPYLSQFNYSEEKETIEAKGFIGSGENDGSMEITDTLNKGTTATVTINAQSIDVNVLSLGYGENWQTTASKTFPVRFEGIVPATPYEVSNSLILGTETNEEIFVTLKSDLGAGAPNYLEYGVDFTVAAGKITFDSAFEGRTFFCLVKKTYTNVKTLGVEAIYGTNETLSFSGIITGSRFTNHRTAVLIPQMQKTSGFTLEIGDGVTEMSMEYRAIVGGDARKAIQLVQYVL